VPFTLVLDGGFQRDVILDDDGLAAAAEGNVLPIDLHLATSELLDDDGMARLEALAADAVAQGASSVTLAVSAERTAEVLGVEMKSTVRRPARRPHTGGSRINVTGSAPRR
jgi:hypothetical protein